MATNCIKVPRFLAQTAPRAVPRRIMCNSAGDAPDRSTANLRHACTAWDTGLEMHKHCEDGGFQMGCEPLG